MGSQTTNQFAPKLLNLFTIESKVQFAKEEHCFCRKFHRENCSSSSSLKDDSTVEIARIKSATIPRCPKFLPFF